MTDLAALAAAAVALPDDDTPRLVWLDEYAQVHGENEWYLATREFVAKCREPRRYDVRRAPTESLYEPLGTNEVVSRRARPGWREWLASPSDTFRADGKPLNADSFPSFAVFHKEHVPDVMNWHRLVPTLWASLPGDAKWRRDGGTISIMLRMYRDNRWFRCIGLKFRNGFLDLVACREGQPYADWLTRILKDQPFITHNLFGQG